MRPVLARLTAAAFFTHNLHNSFHLLVHMLQVKAVCQVLCLVIMQATVLMPDCRAASRL